MKTLITCTIALGALVAEGRIVNVAEHGIVPGQDGTYALNSLIKSIENEPGVTLSFPKGDYEFHAENALEMHRAVANHDNGLKRMVFPLFNHRNITIEGNGSMFMMHGRVVPFTIERVEGITLRNFSIDWAQSFHAELKCIERDVEKKAAVFELDEKRYPHKIKNGQLLFDRMGQEDPIGSNMVWDPETRAPIYDTDRYALNSWKPIKVSKPGKNRIKIEGGFKKEPPPVGTILVAHGVHPTSRLCPAIHVTNSKDLKIENVVVHDAGGMGLIVERTENITLDGMKVTSTEERIVSTRADATHYIGCKGLIKVENCVFEHMLDDAINVHGAYVPVAEYLGNKELLCNISHFQQWGLTFGEPGDKVCLMSRLTVLPLFETTIEDIRILNEHRFVLTLKEVPEVMPNVPLSVENLTWYPDLVFRKNIVRENRARSILVTTKGKVLIEDNHLSSQMHGILIEGDNNKWYESGAVEDVVIRNNEFVNIGFACDNRYPLLASPLFNDTQHMGEGRYHRNIKFIDNTIRSFNGHMVEARSCEGLTISGNKMVFSTDYPAIEEGEAIKLDYCSNVSIVKNDAEGFAPLRITQTVDTESVTIKKNTGFQAAEGMKAAKN
ncbi:Alpha-1,3-galactosidase B [Pontiella desulfatans]|uniref:Alpha-1,3-galactosidase B n=1 Tax=Pontiella desulfatans TaxID=2750659 RepID=A0A6C2UBA7_PONDE|nr:right-handed parallel beta-helix repeat-containing protein [Pontiella desulfatans]VGO17428.1 Alpha-1,3-galactosidase B [Pontiella desulfatans]